MFSQILFSVEASHVIKCTCKTHFIQNNVHVQDVQSNLHENMEIKYQLPQNFKITEPFCSLPVCYIDLYEFLLIFVDFFNYEQLLCL